MGDEGDSSQSFDAGQDSTDESSVVVTNFRVRNHSTLSNDSSNSPAQKKSKSDFSTLAGQSLNLVGWFEVTLIKEFDKKRIGRATTDLFTEKIRELRTSIRSLQRTNFPAVTNTISPPASLVAEFACVVSEKERTIVELERTIAGIQENGVRASYSAVASATAGVPTAAVTAQNLTGRPSRVRAASTKRRNPSLARSKSRMAARKKAVDKVRAASPEMVYRIKTGDQAKAHKAKNDLWTEVCKKTKVPKIVAPPTKSGDLVLKPQNRESIDILAAMA